MQKKQNRVVHFFLIVFIIFFVGLSNIMSRYKVDDSNYSKMNSGWHIEINNTEYENVMLEDFRFPILNKGDILKMKGEFQNKMW